MANTFKFELVSPERLLVSEDVSEVIVPGAEGDFTMLVNHAPFVAMLRPGILRIPSLKGREAQFYLGGGFAEANPDRLTVLAETAMPLEELTAERLDAELAQAKADRETAPTAEARLLAEDVVERLVSLKDAMARAA
jgi:F-type H+-transporting ATPase subunit epsilon